MLNPLNIIVLDDLPDVDLTHTFLAIVIIFTLQSLKKKAHSKLV